MIKKLIPVLIFFMLLSNIFVFNSVNSMQIKNSFFEEEYKNIMEGIDDYSFKEFITNPGNNSLFVNGEIIVKFKENFKLDFVKTQRGIISGEKPLDKINKQYRLKSVEEVFTKLYGPFNNIYTLSFSENASVFDLVKSYQQLSIVEYAEPNYIYNFCTEPNDPLFSKQWALKNIGQMYPWDGKFNPPPGSFDSDIDAPEAWDITTGSSDVLVAIIDTGVDYTHPDIADNIWVNEGEILGNGVDDDDNGYIDDIRGWNFVDNNNDPLDDNGHGTFCAGIIGARGNNGIGAVGVCWDVKIMPVKTLLQSNILTKAIIYAVENGADVISMSWGGYSYSKLLDDAIQYAYSKGIVLVGSAGNDNLSRIHYPSGYKNVISVAATDSNDKKAEFSNYGLWVDVAAPGVDVLSLRAKNTDMYGNGTNIVDEYYYIASGTSFSSPHVAGIAALLLSYNNSLTQDMIRTIISNSLDNKTTFDYYAGGRVNAYKALLKKPAIALLEQYVDWRNMKDTVLLQGEAWSEDFQSYTLEYGVGTNPKTWIQIIEEYTPTQGVLATFDTTDLDEGLYTIRLIVDCNNELYEDKIWIIVNNKCDTLYVDNDNKEGPWTGSIDYPYKKIQDAVNVAGKNDIVFVYNGTYYENVIIMGSLKLIGKDKNNTIIDSNYSGSTISIQSDLITVENFTIQNCGELLDAGILFGSHINSVLIKNNLIKDCNLGVFLFSGATNNEISGNIIENGTILLFIACENNIISKNTIKDSEMGIGLSLSYYNTITENIITGHKYGIFIAFSIKNNIISNNISGNDIGLVFFIWGSHKIYNNNFINNRIHVFFTASKLNRWKGNYWDDWIGLKKPFLRFLPKFISGLAMPGILKSFDWHPVHEPYDI